MDIVIYKKSFVASTSDTVVRNAALQAGGVCGSSALCDIFFLFYTFWSHIKL